MSTAACRGDRQRNALRELRVEQHPDKTFIGRIERGFTFLGYWITEKGVTGIEPSAWEGFQERVTRFYEQDAPREETLRRIGQRSALEALGAKCWARSKRGAYGVGGCPAWFRFRDTMVVPSPTSANRLREVASGTEASGVTVLRAQLAGSLLPILASLSKQA